MTPEEMQEFIRAELQTAITAAFQPAAKSEDGEKKDGKFDIINALDLSGTIDEIKAAHQEAALEQYELARQEAQRQAMLHVAKVRHEADVKELSQVLTSGNNDVPYGLPVKESDLQEFLLRLEPADYEFASDMLRKIQKQGRVAFAELGHAKKQKGTIPVPDYAHSSLRAAIAAGNSVSAFFEAASLGDPSDYDLSDFTEDK